MSTPNTSLSSNRQAAYYTGIALQVIGLVVFVSNFFVGVNRDRIPDLSADAPSPMSGLLVRGLVGMALIAAGQFLMRVGKVGLAGAGVILDPQQARKDVEPWSRAAGGMASDALDEIDPKRLPGAVQVVKVRCRACQQLNDEAAKFCNQCGGKV